MHDLDCTQAEFESDFNPLGSGELEFEDEFEFEEEFEGFDDTETDGPLDEAEEMEMAADLLNVSNEEELEQFLGSVFKRAARSLGKAIKSPIGRALRKTLRPFARRILPWAGRAAGAWIGGPAGAAIGGRVGRYFGRRFELELEGLSPEDQEFEVARRIVRLSAQAAQNAALASPGADPEMAAKAAVVAAAQKHAPGLLRRGSVSRGSGRSGRWIRRGRKIILLGV